MTKSLTHHPLLPPQYVTLSQFHDYGHLVAATRERTLGQRLEAEASWGGETALVEAIYFYEHAVDGPKFKSYGSHIDVMRSGVFLTPLLLRFGATRAYRSWFNKSLAAFQKYVQ